MKSLTSSEQLKLKSVIKSITLLKNQLVENGFSSQQIQNYFTNLIKDTFFQNNVEKKINYSLSEAITFIFMNSSSNTLKVFKKLQTIFYLQRASLMIQYDSETNSRKSSETISEKIKQKKKEIKEKKKKLPKNDKIKAQKLSQQNIFLNQPQTFKFQSEIKNETQKTKISNPLKQSNTISPNIFSSCFSNDVKPPVQIKNVFALPRENEIKEDLSNNIMEINLLKLILEKQMKAQFQEQQQPQNELHELLDLASLLIKR